eukprot:COSAG06_NODE_11693_length_1476_cov_2.692084_2_plen_90_part_00
MVLIALLFLFTFLVAMGGDDVRELALAGGSGRAVYMYRERVAALLVSLLAAGTLPAAVRRAAWLTTCAHGRGEGGRTVVLMYSMLILSE